jgi:hypothetical protein
MGKYLNPKADLTFKKIFGEHPRLVISLLNALLPLQDDERGAGGVADNRIQLIHLHCLH